MKNDEAAIEKLVLTRLMRLNALIIGLIMGILFGGLIFGVTIFLVVKGGPNVGLHLILLDNFFPGYRVSFVGGFIGFIYGFITGFVLGYAVSFLYNLFANLRNAAADKREQSVKHGN